jgi:hypothetical protein
LYRAKLENQLCKVGFDFGKEETVSKVIVDTKRELKLKIPYQRRRSIKKEEFIIKKEVTKKIPLLVRIARKIVEKMKKIGLSVIVVYIPSKENKRADKISKTFIF